MDPSQLQPEASIVTDMEKLDISMKPEPEKSNGVEKKLENLIIVEEEPDQLITVEEEPQKMAAGAQEDPKKMIMAEEKPEKVFSVDEKKSIIIEKEPENLITVGKEMSEIITESLVMNEKNTIEVTTQTEETTKRENGVGTGEGGLKENNAKDGGNTEFVDVSIEDNVQYEIEAKKVLDSMLDSIDCQDKDHVTANGSVVKGKATEKKVKRRFTLFKKFFGRRQNAEGNVVSPKTETEQPKEQEVEAKEQDAPAAKQD